MLLYFIAYDLLNTLYAVDFLDFDKHNEDLKLKLQFPYKLQNIRILPGFTLFTIIT